MTDHNDLDRQLVELLELDVDRCSRVYATAPCAAGQQHSGTAQAGAASTITLDTGASAVDDAYNTMLVYIVSGTGNGQERTISDYVGSTRVATVSSAWTTNPDATSVFRITNPNSAGACYETYKTCQDKANFLKDTKIYRFCSSGSIVSGAAAVFPYVASMRNVPTVVDPDKGLARRALVTVQLTDGPESDREQDDYIANRAAVAGGTFLGRLIGRNHNMVGRTARIKRQYVTPGAAAALSGAWVTEQYIIAAVAGPDRSGAITVSLEDPLKLADRTQVPAPDDGELLSSITSSALSLTLKSGQGADYASSGYLRIDNEIIQYTSKTTDTLSWTDTSYRGKLGTTAVAHNADARVQTCRVWSAAGFRTVIEEILNESSIVDANIDLTGLQSEQDTWLGTLSITACISEPEKASQLLMELCRLAYGVLWWNPVTQKVTFKAIRPLLPGATPPLLTDAGGLIEDTVDVSRQEAERITRAGIYYAPVDVTQKKDEPSNYRRGYIYVDADAEGTNEYNDVREDVFYTRWLDTTGEQSAAEYATHRIFARRNAPIHVKCRIDPKDDDVTIAGQVEIETRGIHDVDGEVLRSRFLVLRRQDNGRDVEIELLQVYLDRRWFWIAPDANPDYTSASETERIFGYLSDAGGLLPDGLEGHLII